MDGLILAIDLGKFNSVCCTFTGLRLPNILLECPHPNYRFSLSDSLS